MRRSMKRVNVKKENKPFKTLAIATIAGLSIIGIGQAQAATLDDIDLYKNRLILLLLIICMTTLYSYLKKLSNEMQMGILLKMRMINRLPKKVHRF